MIEARFHAASELNVKIKYFLFLYTCISKHFYLNVDLQIGTHVVRAMTNKVFGLK